MEVSEYFNKKTIYFQGLCDFIENEKYAARAPRAHAAKFADFLELNS